ncbi:reverse transcriptase domain-containing protein [Tanacetum coccineum]
MQTQMNNLATSNQRLESMLGNFIKMNTTSSSGTRSLSSNTVANPRGELKAITTRSGLVLDEPSVPTPPSFINPEEDERVEETFTDPEHGQFTIKLHINITLADALILILKYQKMLKSLLSNKEKLIELANTPVSENCLAVIRKKLPKNLGASINLMPLSVWKELGLPKLISTQMTLELANRDICTPTGISRDVFVPVGKFTFPVDFVIVDYESDLRVPLILGRPFLRTTRVLIDVHGEEMNLHDGNERLILNMRNDTSSYSNEPHQESINMIDIYNVSHEDFHEDFGNPTLILKPETKSSSSPILISLKESELIWEEFEAYLVNDSFPPGNYNPSSLLPPFHNSLSGSTTSSSPSLHIYEISDYFLEEFADELAHITFSPRNDDLPFDAESDLLELEYLLNHDPIKDMDSILKDSVDENSLDDNLDYTISEMFTDEHALFDLETVNDDTYDDPFYSKEEKIKESKLLIDELDPPRSSDFLSFPECDSVFYDDFSEVDALPSTNNEDKVFNPGILIYENLFEVTNFATPDNNVKKTTNASLILEDFNPSLYELPFHKEVPGLGALLSFSANFSFHKEVPGLGAVLSFPSENEEKVFMSRCILTL